MDGSYGYTVLQIESHAASADLVAQVLARRTDLRLLTAPDGVRGMEMALSLLPDAILMGTGIPFASSFETLTLLQEHRQTAHIPVMVLSANAFVGDDKKCLDAGAFGFLSKPYRIDDLVLLLDLALQTTTGHGPLQRLALAQE